MDELYVPAMRLERVLEQRALDVGSRDVEQVGEVAAQHDALRIERVDEAGDSSAQRIGHAAHRAERCGIAGPGVGEDCRGRSVRRRLSTPGEPQQRTLAD